MVQQVARKFLYLLGIYERTLNYLSFQSFLNYGIVGNTKATSCF